MTVRFYEMTREGAQVIGDIRLEGGRLVAVPEDSHILVNLLAHPLRMNDLDTGEERFLDSQTQPEDFLKGLLSKYRGSQFWCVEIED